MNMSNTTRLLFVVLLFLNTLHFSCNKAKIPAPIWTIVLHEPNGKTTPVIDLPEDLSQSFQQEKELGDFKIQVKLIPTKSYTNFVAKLMSKHSKKAFLSLECKYDKNLFAAYNFNGRVDSAEIFRQSPHDVNAWIVKTIAMQAMPVVALKSDSSFVFAVSDAPFRYNNFTSQAFYPNQGMIAVRAGDDGLSPGIQPDTSEVLNLDYNADKTQIFTPGKVLSYYQPIDSNQSHTFKGIIATCNAKDIKDLRKEIITKYAHHFSSGKYVDYFGALSFTTAYTNLRVNDSGKSKYWVVPAVEYSNIQYGRDAFWISTMLEPEYALECLNSELAEVNHFAEYPLFSIIWAYRAYQDHLNIDLNKVQAYVNAIEQRAKNDAYYSYYEGDGRLDFQYWGDLMAFKKDDVITYNQGLFALALTVAQRMGLKIKSNPKNAIQIYRNTYNAELGYFPVSKFKPVLTPDVLVPDLLAQIYLNQALLPTVAVQKHYERMVRYAKTPYGFKIVSTPTGAYLPATLYDIEGYVSQVNREKIPDGQYFRGGSYFLYDNLFLMDAYLHGIKEAETLLKWRINLDFSIGSTTYETLNTKTGEPWKPNMGWNVAVYAFWKKLKDEGRVKNDVSQSVNK